MSPTPVLLVDDRPQNLFALQEILGSPAYELATASSGAAALREMLRRDFAVVVLDVEMPGMDGLETARLIRSRERSRNTPIIFLTAASPSERTLEGYALGAADYLHKPIAAEVLRSKVAVFAELYRKTRDAEALSRQLRQQAAVNARYAALVEASGDAIVGLRLDGTIESWNPAAERVFGYRAEEIAGRPVSVLLPPGHADELLGDAERLRRGERTGPYETFRLRRDGSRIEVELTVAPIHGEDGAVAGSSVTARDVTQRRRAEQALRERDERFRQVMRFAPVGMALVGLDGRWISVNPALCAILGYTEGELQRLTFQDVTHPEDLGADLERVDRLVAGEIGAYELEKRYIRKGGEAVWSLLSGSLVRSAEGEPLYFIAQVQDISARRTADEELRAAALHLEGVVRTQRDIALAGLEVKRVMEMATGRAMELTGSEGAVIEMAEGEEMVYRAASGTLLPHLGLRLRAAASISGLCARTGEILRTDDCETDARVDREACRRVGARSMLLVPLRHEGAPVGVLKVISGRPAAFGSRDVHTLELMAGLVGAALGQASAFEAKQALLVELDRSNRELREFAYVASHDLQEPLRKIQAFGDRLQARFGAALGEQGSDYISRMQSAAARMQALIQELLAYSRASSKEMALGPVDLDALARDVVCDLSERVAATGGTVEMEPLLTLQADPTQMRQLLQNLVGNALKFHRQGVPPVVRVRAEAGPEWTRIVVQDNGIGFEEQYAGRIFAPFQRLHGRSEYEGTGMGLAICRKIAERHGGHIGVRSVPGEGSTFTVALRTAPATPAEP